MKHLPAQVTSYQSFTLLDDIVNTHHLFHFITCTKQHTQFSYDGIIFICYSFTHSPHSTNVHLPRASFMMTRSPNNTLSATRATFFTDSLRMYTMDGYRHSRYTAYVYYINFHRMNTCNTNRMARLDIVR